MAVNLVSQYRCTDCGEPATRWVAKRRGAEKQSLLDNDPKCAEHAEPKKAVTTKPKDD